MLQPPTGAIILNMNFCQHPGNSYAYMQHALYTQNWSPTRSRAGAGSTRGTCTVLIVIPRQPQQVPLFETAWLCTQAEYCALPF